MPAIQRLFDGIVTASGALVGIAAFFIGITVSYDVLARTLFGGTTGWVVDVNTYLVAFITFVGAGYALREDAHVGVDIIVRRLDPRKRWIAKALSDSVILMTTGILLWLGFEYWWEAWTSGEQSLGLFTVPLWIPFSFLPIGMLLLLMIQIQRTLTTWSKPWTLD